MKRLRRSLHNQTLICEYPGVQSELRGLCLFLPFQHAVAHHVDLIHLGGDFQIVVTHDRLLAEEADRCYRIKRGKIEAE